MFTPQAKELSPGLTSLDILVIKYIAVITPELLFLHIWLIILLLLFMFSI